MTQDHVTANGRRDVIPGAMLRSPLRGLVRGYQLLLSPLVGPACRYHPSCSAYAIEALERHGTARGLWLAAKRLARCHPLGGHGFDPVPDGARRTNR